MMPQLGSVLPKVEYFASLQKPEILTATVHVRKFIGFQYRVSFCMSRIHS